MAEDRCSCWEVRPLNNGDQIVEELFTAGIRMVQRPVDPLRDFTHIMRGDIRRHAYSNTCRTVHQKVGEPAWQHCRFLGLAVVVGDKIDGIFINITYKLHSQRCHTALCISHGSCRIISRRPEIALAVHKQIPHRPRLCHTYQRVIDSSVAVGMVFTHHITDNAGTFVIAAVRPVSPVVHRVDHTAVYRLHAVADIGQCAFNDYRKGICKV